ncbi:MAG: 2-amino-4-hydroxy-6-hydroxymethyldihydropteridine diphosphokinase [Trebonia sp.]|jgi:2-amino-4-hydroxy-6-hydroxymethyldihydropteridine diphosphokinase
MNQTWRAVVLALGSNLGDRQEILLAAVDAVGRIEGVRVEKASPVYETAPVGGPPQPDYLNAVVLARTTLPSLDLLGRLHEVEAEFDRVRLVRWGPRTLDIDIITVAGERSDDPELTLPHPRAHERAFVLAPWHDVDPDAVLPGHGPVADLLKLTDSAGIRRNGVCSRSVRADPRGEWGAGPPCGGSPGAGGDGGREPPIREGRPPGEEQ